MAASELDLTREEMRDLLNAYHLSSGGDISILSQRIRANKLLEPHIGQQLIYPPRTLRECSFEQFMKWGPIDNRITKYCLLPAAPPCPNNAVVIKSINLAHTYEAALIEAFNSKVMLELRDNQLMQTYDTFFCKDNLYLISEYVNGITLLKYIQQNPLRPLKDVFIKIATSVAKWESHHISHRDLHLENIMITADGSIKIIDFGACYSLGPPPTPYLGDNINYSNLKYYPGLDFWTLLYQGLIQLLTETEAIEDVDEWDIGRLSAEVETGFPEFIRISEFIYVQIEQQGYNIPSDLLNIIENLEEQPDVNYYLELLNKFSGANILNYLDLMSD